MEIKDVANSLEELKMDSGIIPKTNVSPTSFVPFLGDLAFADCVKYVFDGKDWIEATEENIESVGNAIELEKETWTQH